jgi:predicted GNAT superfamily acetyltransferase
MTHPKPTIRILETPEEMLEIEKLQKIVWQCSDAEISPGNQLIAAIHGGGLVLGAYVDDQIVGFAFSFPGFYQTPDGPRLKQCSHMLGVIPQYRDQNIGFLLKRAQWQMVRKQGVDRITWTFDPLGSRNAYLNIVKLGAVCNTYWVDCYGPMRDGLNAGLPSDRFEVDWWVNSHRVEHRLSKRPRPPLRLRDYAKAHPLTINAFTPLPAYDPEETPLILVEIPADVAALRATQPELVLQWRFHIRQICEALFEDGYLVTDFVHESTPAQSFYILSHGEATL